MRSYYFRSKFALYAQHRQRVHDPARKKQRLQCAHCGQFKVRAVLAKHLKYEGPYHGSTCAYESCTFQCNYLIEACHARICVMLLFSIYSLHIR